MAKPLIPGRAASATVNRSRSPYVPPLAVVVHRGAGRATVRTPVTVRSGRFDRRLPYGADTDWVRNLLAEGRGSRLGRAGGSPGPRPPRRGRDLARPVRRPPDVLVADIVD